MYPALAVAEAVRLTEPDARFLYAGVRGGIEEAIAAQNDIPFHRVITAAYPGVGHPLRFLWWAFRVGIGTLMATFLLLRARPRILVATGGYVSAPAVFAAVFLRSLRLLRLRIFVHEQNMRPGRFNTLVARFADVVGVSFLGSQQFLQGAEVRYVGYPVRPALRKPVERPESSKLFADIPSGKQLVLAFGGSQGARTVNRAVVDALPHLVGRDDLFILHGIGRQQRGGYDPEADVASRIDALRSTGALPRDLSASYRRLPYIDDIGAAYQRAVLVVCRGGAGTVKEVCAVGRPAVILPKAGLSGDHQVMNALVLEEVGAAHVLLEEPAVDQGAALVPAVSGVRLAELIGGLLDEPERLVEMASAARAIDDPAALQRIRAALDGAEHVPHPQEGNGSGEHRIELKLAEMPPSRLLGWVREHRSRGAAPDAIPGLSYLKYRAASMMTASAWRVRNVGVKLAGLLRLVELIPLLRHLWDDPTPASAFARALGGDRQQNGFIRRNILVAVIRIGRADTDTSHMVTTGLTDGYFETRREACRAVWLLDGLTEMHPELLAAVVERLNDASFEVRLAAIRAVGEALTMPHGLPLLRRFYLDVNWQIRQGVLRAFDKWAKDDPSEETRRLLKAEFSEVLLTAGGYRPLFGLKQTAARVRDGLAAAAEGDAP